MAEPDIDARAALQALFAATRPKTPQGSSILDESADGESAAQRAGVALRQLFKGEFRNAVHPPSAANKLREVEANVSKLLEKVAPSAKFQPPARAQAASRAKTGVDSEVQTLPEFKLSADVKDPVMPEIVPDPDLGKKRPRLCIIPDSSENGAAMRIKCNEARKRLFELDTETTGLKRELKLLQMKHWERERYKCFKEREIDALFAKHAGPNGVAALDTEGLVKNQTELCAARQQAKQWSRQARRLDAELQQQFRGGGDVQRILLRHPAGEVFLPPMGSGDESDDDGRDSDYYRHDHRHGDVQLGSSDEESNDSPKGGGMPFAAGGERGRPQPAQQWRGVQCDDDDDASQASSVTSPSGESGNVPTPNGESAPRHKLGGGPSVLNPRSDTESSSDEERAAPKKASPTGQQSKPVPPLPALSGLNSNGQTAAASPSKAAGAAGGGPEEVSSEDIWSNEDGNESSRSV